MVLKSDNIILRPPTENDISGLAKLGNNKKIFDNVRDAFPHPYEENHATDFIKMTQSHNPQRSFAIEFNKTFAGMAGIHPQADVYRKSAEIGYWIGEEFWGKGIGTKAIRLLIKYGFEYFDLNRLYAGVYEHNIGSMKVLGKCGFFKEGISKKAVLKNGKLIDEHRYAILK